MLAILESFRGDLGVRGPSSRILIGLGLLLGALPGRSRAAAPGPDLKALAVEIRFAGERVELLGIQPSEQPLARQLGIPQLATMFFEVLGPEGEVVYAGTLKDPRRVIYDVEDPATGEMHGGVVVLPEGSLSLLVPDHPDARRVVVYRRDPAVQACRQRISLLDVPVR